MLFCPCPSVCLDTAHDNYLKNLPIDFKFCTAQYFGFSQIIPPLQRFKIVKTILMTVIKYITIHINFCKFAHSINLILSIHFRKVEFVTLLLLVLRSQRDQLLPKLSCLYISLLGFSCLFE